MRQGVMPVPGCLVEDRKQRQIGIVRSADLRSKEVLVQWKGRNAKWQKREELRNGFDRGASVLAFLEKDQRYPDEGRVLCKRAIGGMEQVLVFFPEKGMVKWLPFEKVAHYLSAEARFLNRIPDTGSNKRLCNCESQELFRLRCLARAIEFWHRASGFLTRMEIDPLPHQVQTVKEIVESGNYNWLIADDVGLGKTIELGMLLSVLRERGEAKRILIVTPSGLVKQWKDELFYKFGMEEFRIYGHDMEVSEPREWKMYDFVIGSMDLLKREPHMERLLQAPDWDLVVFDEAHKLSRTVQGKRIKSTKNFRLAARLRRKTKGMIMLSATPHQGDTFRFKSLLELLRPDMKDEIRNLQSRPEIIRSMVKRNNKDAVVDSQGNPIFKGKETHAVTVEMSEAEKDFDASLRAYFRRGYLAGEREEAGKKRAVGLAMNIYRKLAASSIAAIQRAIKNRLDRITGRVDTEVHGETGYRDCDYRFQGEEEEKFLESVKDSFFTGEEEMLHELLSEISRIRPLDSKLKAFMDLIKTIQSSSDEKKVVIFTEYRSTQAYLASALGRCYGHGRVKVMNGTMSFKERASAIADFEDNGLFLVSTEAGGEGINLHRRCHIMVNYDLPWNPMRLVQRVGRLYRYGQKKKVLVFNMNTPETLDGRVLSFLYHKIEEVVKDMCQVDNKEFHQGLDAQILGDVSALVDVEKVLEAAGRDSSGFPDASKAIEKAVTYARQKAELQHELFSHLVPSNGRKSTRELELSIDHVKSFFMGMSRLLGITVSRKKDNSNVFEVMIPPSIREDLSFESRLLVTFQRDVAAVRPEIHLVDMNSFLLRYMLDCAKRFDFGGKYAEFVCEDGGVQAIMPAILRWQDGGGARRKERLLVWTVSPEGHEHSDPAWFLRWLLNPVREVGSKNCIPAVDRMALLNMAERFFDTCLRDLNKDELFPESVQIIGIGLFAGIQPEVQRH